MHVFLRRIVSGFVGVALAMMLLPMQSVMPTIAHAAVYSALQVTNSGGGTMTMTPGEVKTLTTTFQNTSDFTWKNDGTGYVSLYTYSPKYRTSVFDPGTWLSPSQVTRMKEASVGKGKTGTFTFSLKAPSTVGTYKETFNLASESFAWFDGGQFSLNIVVKAKTVASTTSSSAVTSITTPVVMNKAVLAMVSANKVKVVAGKSVTLSAGFKNTGTTTWTNFGLKTSDLSIASTSNSGDFQHVSWKGDVLALATQTVKPGETAVVTFAITAPKTNGIHTTNFQFTANGEAVDDAFVDIPVEVTGGAPEVLASPKDSSVNDGAQGVAYITEPTMRVGVLIVDEETQNQVVITSSESDFDVKDIEGNLLAEMKMGQSVTAAWDGKTYTFNRGKGVEKVSSGIRFIPKIANAVMKVSNFDRTVTRGSSNADNTFRNILEIRYNTPNDRTWLINELPMEYYLRGLAETSNISPAEFQKTLITAARTYAFYHWSRATKHASEFYHVDAWLDQVYKGYGQEQRTPNLTAAVDATRGRIVTYQGETAITPYFSRSDGHTRNWSDVWFGSVPWAVSVLVPCDNGKTLWGHGVGMSASGALCMANQGQTYDQILKYFYTGVDVGKKWE